MSKSKWLRKGLVLGFKVELLAKIRILLADHKINSKARATIILIMN